MSLRNRSGSFGKVDVMDKHDHMRIQLGIQVSGLTLIKIVAITKKNSERRGRFNHWYSVEWPDFVSFFSSRISIKWKRILSLDGLTSNNNNFSDFPMNINKAVLCVPTQWTDPDTTPLMPFCWRLYSYIYCNSILTSKLFSC